MSAIPTIDSRITYYEAVSLLGKRARDIADGSLITIKNPGTDDPHIIAELERKVGRFPLKLIREYPDGTKRTLNTNMMTWPC
jgi:DNA-directed RNA polymerase subunit K/omega